MRRLSLVALGTLLVDVVTKNLATRYLPQHGSPVSVIGDWVRFSYVKNYGSSFGLIQGGRVFFIGFSLLSILLILALARRQRCRRPAYAFSLGLILGGALGNLVDRILFGPVVDFIDMGIGSRRWPTYNVADIGITVGVVFLAVLLLEHDEKGGGATGGAAEPGSGESPAGQAAEETDRLPGPGGGDQGRSEGDAGR